MMINEELNFFQLILCKVVFKKGGGGGIGFNKRLPRKFGLRLNEALSAVPFTFVSVVYSLALKEERGQLCTHLGTN